MTQQLAIRVATVLVTLALAGCGGSAPSTTPLPTPGATTEPTIAPTALTPTATLTPTIQASPSTPARTLTPTIPGTPANDNPPGIAITSLPFSDSTDTTRAQIHAMEGSSLCGFSGWSVWYSYTADQAATLVADTYGSDYDTILDIWTGSLTSDYQNPGFETLVPLACNDNAGGSLQSAIVFNVKSGVSYVIRVSSSANATGGALTFHLARG